MERPQNRTASLSDALKFFDLLWDGLVYLSPIFGCLVLIIVLNGLIIGRLERWRPDEALYHAFITATTVGYGDFRPTRPVTRLLSVVNAILGLLMTGIFVGLGVYAVQFAILAREI